MIGRSTNSTFTSDGSAGLEMHLGFSVQTHPQICTPTPAFALIKVVSQQLAMCCRHLVYMSTHCDEVLCHWLVATSIVRASKVPSDIPYLRTLQLAHNYFMHSSCARTCTHSSSPYLLLSNVNEPVSLSVQIVYNASDFSCRLLFHCLL